MFLLISSESPIKYFKFACYRLKKLYMRKFSERLLSMEESATLAMSRKSRELKSQGLDIIWLSFGELNLDTQDFVKVARFEPLNETLTINTLVPGYEV